MKKFLSLVLALVMTFSLVTIASAKDYTDQASIKNTEAVGVVSGLGIIGGYEDGSYKPANTLTRQAATKFIANMKLGPTIAGMLPAGASFKDVPANSQFAGWIAYCADNGIVNGVTADTFNPGGTLTGYAFVKMLLNAAGVEGNYVGDGWQARVLQAALKAKIVDTAFVGSAAITRDDAALYTFNALQYAPNGTTSKYVVKDAKGNVLYTGTDALTALVMAQSKEGNELALVETSEGSLGDVVFDLNKTSKVDEFGRKSVVYDNGKDTADKDYVEYVAFAPKAVLTYTEATTYGKVVSALGFTKVADEVTFTVYNNSATASSTKVTANKTTATVLGAQGTLVEVYKTGAKTCDVVIVDTYAKKLAKTDVVAAKKATATKDAEAAYIKLDGTLTYETDAFKAGDVVLYTKADGKVVNVVKAASVAGTVNATGTGYFRVDGTKYVPAAHASLTYNLGKEYTFFLDTYGNAILNVEGKQAEVETLYTYVLATAAQAAGPKTTGSDLFDDKDGTAAYAQAKVIDLATGEIKVVNLGVVKNTAGDYVYADANGAATTIKVVDAKSLNVNTLYTYYALADGSYVLGAPAKLDTVTLEKGKADIGGMIADSATVLKVIELTKKDGAVVSAKVSTSTGIANFPANKTSYNALVAKNDAGIVTSITAVVDAKAPEAVANYAVFAGVGETVIVGGETKTKLAFYVGGEKVEYYGDPAGLKAGSVYDLTVVNGAVTKADAVSFTKSEVAVTYVDNTFFVADGSVYYFADTCTVVDAGADYAKTSVAEDAKVSFVVVDGKVTFVVVAAVAE